MSPVPVFEVTWHPTESGYGITENGNHMWLTTYGSQQPAHDALKEATDAATQAIAGPATRRVNHEQKHSNILTVPGRNGHKPTPVICPLHTDPETRAQLIRAAVIRAELTYIDQEGASPR